MRVESFLTHHGLTDNPFAAEEARLDQVFSKLADSSLNHPDVNKIFGAIDRPSTAVVFGEKGSGKTAIRLTLTRKIADHNRNITQTQDTASGANSGGTSGGGGASGGRVLAVAYDDFNPVLDRLTRAGRKDTATLIKDFRLADHQDAILALAVTRLVEALLKDSSSSDEPAMDLPDTKLKAIRKRLSRQHRLDLAVLAGLYDQPPSGLVMPRWRKLRRALRLGWVLPLVFWRNLAFGALLFTLIFGGWFWWLDRGSAATTTELTEGIAVAAGSGAPGWMLPVLGLSAAATVILFVVWAYLFSMVWGLSRRVAREMPAVGRTSATLRKVFGELGVSTLAGQPLPQRGGNAQETRDTRYQLTRRFVQALKALGYNGMVVMIDRVDEPTAIAGDPAKMRSLIWPMFDNKFLKQEGIGLKLLLPVELSYLLQKEGPAFFQEARLDKQNMIERLNWSGATLYDLCSSRLNACRSASIATPLTLTSLFEEDVTRQTLIDALDQMHQPRDAFKFLYSVIQEHCRILPEDAADFHINRLTLETVRRTQSQRVQELYRGLTPA